VIVATLITTNLDDYPIMHTIGEIVKTPLRWSGKLVQNVEYSEKESSESNFASTHL
jgi:hypothetical protein